jgi:tRNA threonylcarbamoyladenosine biosynthesis protein TsaB
VRILALETSGTQGSVAILESGVLLAQAELPLPRRSAQSLIPAVAEQLAAVGWKPVDVQLVAVTQGPGSFTGLRVGVTAAKTLAYAVGAEVLGVDTLEVVAAQSSVENSQLWAVMDAQREQLFAALFRQENDGMLIVLQATHLVDADRWLAELESSVAVSGPAVCRLTARLPATAVTTPQETWLPMAGAVGRLAWRDYLAGRRDDLWKLTPNYFRTSAAEEKKPK